MSYDPFIPDHCWKDGSLIGSLFIQHLVSSDEVIHMISYDYIRNHIYGILQKGEYVVQIDITTSYSTIIIANITMKTMSAFSRTETTIQSSNELWKWEEAMDGYLPIDTSNMHQGNTNMDGMSWFGGVLQNIPFGYGDIVNKNNVVIYEGFLFEGERVCWGMQFDPKTRNSVYEGGLYRDSYCGYGVRKTSTAPTIRKGIWLNGELSKGRKKKIIKLFQLPPRFVQEELCGKGEESALFNQFHQDSCHILQDTILEIGGVNIDSTVITGVNMDSNDKTSTCSKSRSKTKTKTKTKTNINPPEEGYPLPLLHSYMEELIVQNHVDSPWASNGITFHWLINLRLINIADHCYKHIPSLSLFGLISLESLSIGENSFSSMEYYSVPFTPYTASIIHCPCLRTIHIKKYAMNNYGRLVLEDLPSLESVHVEEYSFAKGFYVNFQSR